MVKRAHILAGLGVASIGALFLLAPKASASVPAVPAVTGVIEDGSGLTDKQRAEALILELDQSQFGGWFGRLGAHKMVSAIWKMESGYNPAAVNESDPYGGAHGIGQVLADVARIDYGVEKNDLYNLRIGALTSMRHMRRQYDDLTSRLGQAPTRMQWVMAYNAGARGVAEGRRPWTYYAKFQAAFAVI